MPIITFEVDLKDGATSALQQILQQARAAGIEISGAFGPATNALNQHAKASQGLQGVIREERQEHRMRAFAVREGASAIGALAGEGSGLSKVIQQGAGSLFEFDFAIKAATDSMSKGSGAMGTLGKAIGGAAVPISIALGAILLIRNALQGTEDRAKAAGDGIKELNVKMGNLNPTTSQLAAEMGKVAAHTQDTNTWSLAWRGALDGVLRTSFELDEVQAEHLEGMQKELEASEKLHAARVALAVMEKETMTTLSAITVQRYKDAESAAEEALKTSGKVGAIKIATLDDIWKTEIRNEQREREAELNREEHAALAADDVRNNEEKVDAIRRQYAAKRAQMESEITQMYVGETIKRKEASVTESNRQSEEWKKASDWRVSQDEIATDRSNALTLARLKLEQSTAKTMAADKESEVLLEEMSERKELDKEEQFAKEKEIQSRGLYADLGSITSQYEVKRQQLAQNTANKIHAIDEKHKEEHSHITTAIGEMNDKVQTGIANGFGNAIAQSILSAQNLGDAFVQVGEKIIAELITMIAEAAIFDALTALFSGGISTAFSLGSGFSLPSLGATPSIPRVGFASGADFTVPPGFDNDRFPMQVSSGEHVSVTPAGQTPAAQAGPPVVINVSAMDAKSFQDFIKQGSIADAIMTQMRRTIGMGR